MCLEFKFYDFFTLKISTKYNSHLTAEDVINNKIRY